MRSRTNKGYSNKGFKTVAEVTGAANRTALHPKRIKRNQPPKPGDFFGTCRRCGLEVPCNADGIPYHHRIKQDGCNQWWVCPDGEEPPWAYCAKPKQRTRFVLIDGVRCCPQCNEPLGPKHTATAEAALRNFNDARRVTQPPG